MLGDKAYDSAELRKELDEHEAYHSKSIQQERAVHVQQTSLQAALAD
jgi:hypothetical protein